MDCQEAQNWLVSHIMGDLEAEPCLKLALEEHLRTCKACAEEYREHKKTIEFIQANKAEFAAAIESCERREALEREGMKRSWQAIEAKLDKNEGKHKNTNIFKILWKPVAAAACIAITISLFFVMFTHNDDNRPASPQMLSSTPSVKIEDISESDKVLIVSGQQIVSSNQLKTLLINEKHRLIMDENSSITIMPLISDEHIGCSVTLVSGRIYTHVEHDGDPFIVETPNGKAIITGTTFDIEANESKTKLIVAEGTVNFVSQAGSVDVSAGYSSEILPKSAPTQPKLCDTKQLTAWATGYELKTTLAKIEAISDSFDISDLWLTAYSGPIDLEKIDYKEWIEKNRDWFKREFPQIFRLKEALEKERIKTDYPELLYASGSIWQISYPQISPYQIPFLTFDSLLKVTLQYNHDQQWLLENLPSSKGLMDKHEGTLTGQNAFSEWQNNFEQLRKAGKSPDSGLLLYSLHAGTYLVNTRTLAWLYIANENTGLTSEDKANLLTLLQNEVNETEKIKEYIIRLFTISENCPCEEFNVLIDKVIDSLTEIMEIEEKIKNEIHTDTFL